MAQPTTLPTATTVSSPDELEARAIAWRRHLHANPELSFEEHETSAFVEQTLRSFGGLEIERPAGTAVVARLHGARPGKVVVLRADMDALADPRGERRPARLDAPGVMHACGHDGHTAMLLGAAQILVERRDELAGEVRFVFQHAEELPPGGARAIVEAGVVEGADLVAGVHLLSGLETGKVSAVAGPVMAAADLFTLEIIGRGGHGANPHETVDPVAVAAQVITNLQQIVARETDPFDSVVVSVTTLDAGTARNMIPGSVRSAARCGRSRSPGAPRCATRWSASSPGVTAAHRADVPLRLRGRLRPGRQRRDASAAVREAVVAELGEEALVEFSAGDGRRGLLRLRCRRAGRVLLGRDPATRSSGRRSRITIRASTSTRPPCATASPSSRRTALDALR